MATNYAVKSILNSYDSDSLRDIAEHGCVSGCAQEHIYYTETSEFFDKYESDIEEYLADIFGEDFMFHLVTDCHDMTDMKNKLVWTFIELVASDYMNQMTDEGEEDLDGTDELWQAFTYRSTSSILCHHGEVA